MSGILKFSGGIALLLLFLFPQAQKGWHDFEHRHDFHCESSDVHLHQLEHVCEVCDITVVVGLENKFINYDIFLNAIRIAFSNGNAITFPVCFWQSLPSRAPPVFLS